MTFLSFLDSLPFPPAFSALFLAALFLLVTLGIYKFLKDWLPW